jgi:hypothetical protein
MVTSAVTSVVTSGVTSVVTSVVTSGVTCGVACGVTCGVACGVTCGVACGVSVWQCTVDRKYYLVGLLVNQYCSQLFENIEEFKKTYQRQHQAGSKLAPSWHLAGT